MVCTEVVSYNNVMKYLICVILIVHVRVVRDVACTSQVSMLTFGRLITRSHIHKIKHACSVKDKCKRNKMQPITYISKWTSIAILVRAIIFVIK